MCGGNDTAGEILLCDWCNLPVHAHCVGFIGPVEGDWFCCNECSEHNPADEEVAPVYVRSRENWFHRSVSMLALQSIRSKVATGL